MTAEAAAFQASWSVGDYTATLTMPRAKAGQTMHACIEWAPEMPTRLTPAEMKQYREGRGRALAEMATALDVRVGVIEL